MYFLLFLCIAMFLGMAQVAEQLAMWLRQQPRYSGFCFGIRFFPLIFWLAWFIGRPTLTAGIGPVEFPFQIFSLCDLSLCQFLLVYHPFVHEVIYGTVMEPHADRRDRGHVIVIVILCLDGIACSILLFAWNHRKEMQCLRIILVQPEECLHDVLGRTGHRGDKVEGLTSSASAMFSSISFFGTR